MQKYSPQPSNSNNYVHRINKCKYIQQSIDVQQYIGTTRLNFHSA